MEGAKMRIAWIVGQSDQNYDVAALKAIGPLWGTWQSWRKFKTDNVVVTDFSKAVDLTGRAFHSVCNLYLPEDLYQAAQRPAGVRLFARPAGAGDLAALMGVVATVADIVLIIGLRPGSPNEEREVKSIVLAHPNIQWVSLDATEPFFGGNAPPNCLVDTTANVLAMLSG